ncbi:hypothetical protein KBZ10_03325 [Streptomyces sp. F63]|nr:hypothetical protein [Streptomyces sp. F63]
MTGTGISGGGPAPVEVPEALAAAYVRYEGEAGRAWTAAPPGMRRLGDVAAGMLRRLPAAGGAQTGPAERRLLAACGGAVRELAGESGDRLLYWDLHYENVLAPLPGSGREPRPAIDPKPLAGDPGFDLLPALRTRWDGVTATGDIPRAVRRRFDLLTDILGLDRARARGWTLGRVLQTCLRPACGRRRAERRRAGRRPSIRCTG